MKDFCPFIKDECREDCIYQINGGCNYMQDSMDMLGDKIALAVKGFGTEIESSAKMLSESMCTLKDSMDQYMHGNFMLFQSGRDDAALSVDLMRKASGEITKEVVCKLGRICDALSYAAQKRGYTADEPSMPSVIHTMANEVLDNPTTALAPDDETNV